MHRNETTPTLMFHGIHSRHMPLDRFSDTERFYTIGENRLTEIVGRIVDFGWTVTTFLSAARRGGLDAHRVCITFDDSYLSHYVNALPILDEFNLSAIFFITVGEVGRRGRLSWSQVRALADCGMSVQSHTVSHRRLDRLSDDQVRHELSDSKLILEDATGREVSMLSLPGGAGGTRAARLAWEAGYHRVFGSRAGYGFAGHRSRRPKVILRHAVKAGDPLQTCLDHLNPTLVSRTREWMTAFAAAAAKDVLGERVYESLKAYPARHAARPVIAEQR